MYKNKRYVNNRLKCYCSKASLFYKGISSDLLAVIRFKKVIILSFSSNDKRHGQWNDRRFNIRLWRDTCQDRYIARSFTSDSSDNWPSPHPELARKSGQLRWFRHLLPCIGKFHCNTVHWAGACSFKSIFKTSLSGQQSYIRRVGPILSAGTLILTHILNMCL